MLRRWPGFPAGGRACSSPSPPMMATSRAAAADRRLPPAGVAPCCWLAGPRCPMSDLHGGDPLDPQRPGNGASRSAGRRPEGPGSSTHANVATADIGHPRKARSELLSGRRSMIGPLPQGSTPDSAEGRRRQARKPAACRRRGRSSRRPGRARAMRHATRVSTVSSSTASTMSAWMRRRLARMGPHTVRREGQPAHGASFIARMHGLKVPFRCPGVWMR